MHAWHGLLWCSKRVFPCLLREGAAPVADTTMLSSLVSLRTLYNPPGESRIVLTLECSPEAKIASMEALYCLTQKVPKTKKSVGRVLTEEAKGLLIFAFVLSLTPHFSPQTSFNLYNQIISAQICSQAR